LQEQSQASAQNCDEIGGVQEMVGTVGSLGTAQKQFSIQVFAVSFEQRFSLSRQETRSSLQEQLQALAQKEEENGGLHFTIKVFEATMRLDKMIRTNRTFIVVAAWMTSKMYVGVYIMRRRWSASADCAVLHAVYLPSWV
jgi:hypothetical protein